jgi:hypothetical protein
LPRRFHDLPLEWYQYAAHHQVERDHIYVVRSLEDWHRLCAGRQAQDPELTRGLAWVGHGGERHLALFWADGPYLPVAAIRKYFLHELGHHVLGHVQPYAPSDRFLENAEREAETWALLEHRDWILPHFAYVASYDTSHDRPAYRAPWKKFWHSLTITEARSCLGQVEALAQEVREYVLLWKTLQREAAAAVEPPPELEGGRYTQQQIHLLEKWALPTLRDWLARAPYRG